MPPQSTSGDVAGWLYLNLNDVSKARPRQNWVISSMRRGTYAVDVRAAAMGNGCSPPVLPSSYPGTVIGPLP